MDALNRYEEDIDEIARRMPIKTGSFLITGATGLIGRCIVETLLLSNEKYNTDFKIYVLGRSKERIRNRLGDRVIPIIQDITEKLDDNLEFDYIIHAASNADPKMYAEQPVETILTNIIGSKNVFEYCKKHGNVRVLITSSFEVYGRVEGEDFYDESMSGVLDLSMLRNGYPESKRCAELLLRGYVQEYGITAMIARLASIYGPTMLENDSKAHAQFIRNAMKGEPIVLKSEGKQRRTYCYVVDAVSAIFKILLDGRAGEIYNVANENSIASIAEVAETVANIAGTHVIFGTPDKVEQKGFSKVQNCILDNSKLRDLGWQGKFDLKRGMEHTIERLQDKSV